ncbi:MAG: guanylate kinase [Lachnospiraceae bacterium]|nr:guanylate kinase [Lachnospiraceae bacterium]
MEGKGLLTVISGFSGAGKGTLVKRLISDYDNYALSVSMTTRAPRAGEENGVHYFFIDKEEFERHIEAGDLLEYARYVDNYYGTPKSYVEKMLGEGKDVILEIEIQGALKVKELMPEALLLFVTPPSAYELKSRLVGRGTETEEVINKRIARAGEESQGVENYEYIIINDDLDQCVTKTHEIIQNAKFSPIRKEAFIEKIRKELADMSKGE